MRKYFRWPNLRNMLRPVATFVFVLLIIGGITATVTASANSRLHSTSGVIQIAEGVVMVPPNETLVMIWSGDKMTQLWVITYSSEGTLALDYDGAFNDEHKSVQLSPGKSTKIEFDRLGTDLVATSDGNGNALVTYPAAFVAS